jgi:hypothetical protein
MAIRGAEVRNRDVIKRPEVARIKIQPNSRTGLRSSLSVERTFPFALVLTVNTEIVECLLIRATSLCERINTFSTAFAGRTYAKVVTAMNSVHRQDDNYSIFFIPEGHHGQPISDGQSENDVKAGWRW